MTDSQGSPLDGLIRMIEQEGGHVHVGLMLPMPTIARINEVYYEDSNWLMKGDTLWLSICSGFDDLLIWFKPEEEPLVKVELTKASLAYLQEHILPLMADWQQARNAYFDWLRPARIDAMISRVKACLDGAESDAGVPDVPEDIARREADAEDAIREALQVFVDTFGVRTASDDEASETSPSVPEQEEP